MSYRNFGYFSLLPVAWLVFASGCGDSGRPEIPTVSVSGTVLMDGKPLADAQVNLMTDQYAGVGSTDAAGKFQMLAQAGENKVYIVKYEGLPANFDATMVAPSDMPGGGPKMLVAPRFSDPAKTELKFSVPESGADNANFEVSAR